MRRQFSVSGIASGVPVTVQALLFASKSSFALPAAISSELPLNDAAALTGFDNPRVGSLNAMLKSICWMPVAPVKATTTDAVVFERAAAGGKLITLPPGNLTAGLLDVIVAM